MSFILWNQRRFGSLSKFTLEIPSKARRTNDEHKDRKL